MTITYAQARDDEQIRILTPAVNAFINNYKDPATVASTCRGQTVFFFPGGMGSKLIRARQPYQEGVGVPAGMAYDPLWVDWDIFLGGWRKLKLQRDAMGCFRDHHDRIIVADGAVSVDGITPHDVFEALCANHDLNLFVFGWDWRRRPDETVDFFLHRFLPFFRERVMANGLSDPLADFSLVGHSFGGMIVNLLARSEHPIIANMTAAITVGTPSYGYSGQAHRWFRGEPWLMWPEIEFLNLLGLNNLVEAVRHDMLELISSLPALYTLNFLDEVTYATNQAQLGAGAPYQLASYPSMDATVPGLRVDAFNPVSSGTLGRYPGNTGFDHAELAHGLAVFQQLSSPLPAAVAPRFHSVRGVSTNLFGAVQNNSVGQITWGWVAPGFDPSGPSPIADGPAVPGDDTHPAWSARLLAAGAATATIPGWLIQHACLLNHPLIVLAIGTILCPPAPNPKFSAKPKGEKPASDEEVKELLRWIYQNRARRRTWLPLEAKGASKVLPPRLQKRFGATVRRIFSDLVRGPRPEKPQGKIPNRRKPSSRRAPRRRGTRKRPARKPSRKR